MSYKESSEQGIIMRLFKGMLMTGNQLKILAALLMLVDHIGVMLYPNIIELRIIGRLSFPIFAFFIAEGCVHTKNKKMYFLGIFLLGIFCQMIFFFTQGRLDLGILITFSVSILLCYLLNTVKQTLFSRDRGVLLKILLIVAFVLAVGVTYIFNQKFYVDYGFFGCVLPAFACLFRSVQANGKTYLQKLDHNFIHVIIFGIGLYLLSIDFGTIQLYSLLALPLLFLYSGKLGKHPMKWFFYIFYPVHFAMLALMQQLFF